MRIAGNITAEAWQTLDLSNPEDDAQDWKKAAELFKTRIQKRFIEPANVLVEVDFSRARDARANGRPEDAPTFGFAIMSLDCLLIETLQGAIEGLVDHEGESTRLVADFLTKASSFRRYFNERKLALNFYREVRSNLVHAGATSSRIRINAFQTTPLLRHQRNGLIEINRTHFHKAVVREFDTYIQTVVGHPNSKPEFRLETVKRRANLKTVMDHICS